MFKNNIKMYTGIIRFYQKYSEKHNFIDKIYVLNNATTESQ